MPQSHSAVGPTNGLYLYLLHKWGKTCVKQTNDTVFKDYILVEHIQQYAKRFQIENDKKEANLCPLSN